MPRFRGIIVRILINKKWCFTLRLHDNLSHHFKVSHLLYVSLIRTQYLLTVKVHRVFPYYCGYAASSPTLQFRWAPSRDSAQIVTPFVQVGTYPTRNFATLGSSELRPPFTGTYFWNTLFLHFVFLHRAGVRPYTSSYDLAKSCVFNKQLQVSFCVIL